MCQDQGDVGGQTGSDVLYKNLFSRKRKRIVLLLLLSFVSGLLVSIAFTQQWKTPNTSIRKWANVINIFILLSCNFGKTIGSLFSISGRF